ncbi:MAG: VIT family protein [Microthrixaceae bacterium]|nr:VIT family protein [Microthrixaceae bacterium]
MIHQSEPHRDDLNNHMSRLRAGVLGANDGIISTAGLVIGVAAATTDTSAIATAGVAGLISGAVSMALGEFVSVSTQRDVERALIRKERQELEEMPVAEHQELIEILRQQGLTAATAKNVADELTAEDPLEAHLRVELGIDRHNLTRPWGAAGSSLAAFSVGALLPLIAVLVSAASIRIPVTFAAVLLGLCATGFISARLGGSSPAKAVVRLLVGGAAAMAITYAVGQLVGTFNG